MAFIDIKNLSYSYKDDDGLPVKVLKNINIEIEKGQYVAILGHNGSGKSTLAKLLNMVIDDYDYFEGKIIIDGVDITDDAISEDDIFELRKRVGMVFQNPDNQLVATIVEEDVAFGPENLGLPRDELRRRVDYALETVGMTKFARHEPHRLSGGQKQRIAIAGIIAMMPECMIFDESTAMLDPVGRREVISTIEKLNREKGITVITITHYMDEAARADRVIVINDGRVTLDGTPYEVFSEVDKLHSIGLESPQGTELVRELSSAGVKIDGNSLTEEECVEALYNFLSKIKE